MQTNEMMYQAEYNHVTVQGSAYDAGREQGETLRQIPGWLQFIASGKATFPRDDFLRRQKLYETYLPEIVEEIQGMADATGVRPDEVMYYAYTYLQVSGCSHFVVLPPATASGHVLVGRTYDFSNQSNDNRLVTTRITGKYASIGSSIMLFGRSDGMNEHGLSVTTSSGGLPVGAVRPAIQDGFQFWALTRLLLDRCRNVDEALELIQEFPLSCNPVYILADRSGQAALVEIYGERKTIKRVQSCVDGAFLSATNHFNLNGMAKIEPRNMQHSLVRKALIDRFLQAKSPQVTPEDIRELLGKRYPQGLCCHAYEEYFGMLHAAVYDLTSGEAQICFGSAACNPWHNFTIGGKAETESYTAVIPLEKAPADFW